MRSECVRQLVEGRWEKEPEKPASFFQSALPFLATTLSFQLKISFQKDIRVLCDVTANTARYESCCNFFFFSAKAKSPLHWKLKLAISPWAGRLWSTFRWATSTLIISHNVSTHEISQVVCSASHSQNAADTSLRCDLTFIQNQVTPPHESNIYLHSWN